MRLFYVAALLILEGLAGGPRILAHSGSYDDNRLHTHSITVRDTYLKTFFLVVVLAFWGPDTFPLLASLLQKKKKTLFELFRFSVSIVSFSFRLRFAEIGVSCVLVNFFFILRILLAASKFYIDRDKENRGNLNRELSIRWCEAKPKIKKEKK